VDSTQDNTQEVQSALVNLGMKRAQAAQLAKQAVQGRDFDSAIRWAIAQAA
jgi:Holliday junction resolvasome RuvABC DNA-binding subunit